jgi:hypothetical protein
VNLLGLGDPLEPHASRGPEAGVARVLQLLREGGGDQDLFPLGARRDPRGQVHGSAEEALLVAQSLAHVKAHAHADGLRVLRPGDELFGLSFEELARRGVGPVEVEDGTGRAPRG